jgi:steroid delta-isomerase-like uncharacterized protein
MSAQDGKSMHRRFVEEAFNRGNLDVADEIYAPSFVAHDPTTPEEQRSPGDVKRFVAMYRSAFSDGRSTVEDQVAEGDTVVYRWTYRGTHDGELMGIAPTGKEVTIWGITISRIEDGKIVEEWNSWDMLGVMQQVGAVPAMTQA